MAVLILLANTASPITVSCRRAGKSAPRRVGGAFPSFNATLRTSVRGEAKVIPIATSYLTAAEESAIQVAIANGVQIACSGDILGNVQTLCSFDSVTSDIVPGTSPELWTMTFTINEVNASTVLLKYAPSDVVTGEIFTRSTVGYQLNGAGFPISAAIDTKRDSHYLSGVRSLLLEASRTNSILRSNDFSNASWVKTSVTVTTGIADPSGGTTACTLTASGANGTVVQNLAAGGSADITNSVWLRRRTGSGTIKLQGANGVDATVVLTGVYQRLSTTSAATLGRNFAITIATNGDAIDAWMGDQETGAFATSEIATVAAPVARGADSYSLPYTTPPQESTFYVKFSERGTLQTAGARVLQIGNAGDAAPRFAIHSTGSFYSTFHDSSTATVTATLAAAPAFGDVVELLAHLYADGSVDLTQSINGGAATATAQTGANALASAWSGLLTWLNSGGSTNLGFTALQSFKIVSGARSLAEMRGA